MLDHLYTSAVSCVIPPLHLRRVLDHLYTSAVSCVRSRRGVEYNVCTRIHGERSHCEVCICISTGRVFEGLGVDCMKNYTCTMFVTVRFGICVRVCDFISIMFITLLERPSIFQIHHQAAKNEK